MINEERVRKGITALRSGEYSQARGALRKGDCFCALGVACETYRQETRKGRWHKEGFFCVKLPNDYEQTADDVMPRVVSQWYGFDSTDPVVYYRDTISHLNDAAGMNFNEIADKLEEFFFPSRV